MKHLAGLGLEKVLEYRFCEEHEGTPEHRISECIATTNQRKESFGQEIVSGGDIISSRGHRISGNWMDSSS